MQVGSLVVVCIWGVRSAVVSYLMCDATAGYPSVIFAVLATSSS